MPLLQVQAGTATQKFSTLYDTLDSVKQQMIEGNLDNFINIATLIGGLGALFYMAYRVWGSLARAESVDVFPLLRPFALGLLIMNFGWVTGFLDTIISPIESATYAMVTEGEDVLNDSRVARQKAIEAKNVRDGKSYLNSNEEYDKKLKELGLDIVGAVGVSWEVTAYTVSQGVMNFIHDALQWIVEAIKLAISVVSTFYLIMLSIFGPLVFGFACFDGFGHGLTAWISRYISISLWAPICDVLASMLNKIEVLMNNIDIQTIQMTDTADDASWWFFIVFYIISLIAYTTVPTIAGWIIEGGGTGGLNRSIIGAVNGVAKAPAAVSGAIVGLGAGLSALSASKSLKSMRDNMQKMASSKGPSSEKDSTGSAPQG